MSLFHTTLSPLSVMKYPSSFYHTAPFPFETFADIYPNKQCNTAEIFSFQMTQEIQINTQI
jgi:hypothetical protein